MALTEQPTRTATRQLSASLFVAVTARGLVIPPIGGHPAVVLGLADLALLSALVEPDGTLGDVADAVASATGVDCRRLLVTLDALEERRRLVPVTPRPEGFSRRPQVADAAVVDLTALDAGPRAGAPGVGAPGSWVLRTPLLARPVPGGLEVCDHDGRTLAVLTPREAMGAVAFGWPASVEDAHRGHLSALADQALDRGAFDELAGRLWGAGLLVLHDGGGSTGGVDQVGGRELRRLADLLAVCDREADRRRQDREVRRRSGATARPMVVPCSTEIDATPLALGMLLAAIAEHDDGRLLERYDLEPLWLVRRRSLRRLVEEGPIVLLLSNYVWSHQENLAMAALVKERVPDSIVICGGPDTPAYPDDCEAYLRTHPEVDVVVRGEGEDTVVEVLDALDGELAGRDGDLSVLAGVAGVAYRDGARIVRTPERERIADLDRLPSPYLSGTFASLGEATVGLGIVETNRGCPYGCTFCDWGSATRSRIRQFPLDRVFAEIEWLARHRIPRLFLADANFGILERDVEIAEHVARMRQEHGFPVRFGTNFAKNTVKHTRHIVEVLVSSGLITEACLSLQTVDQATLDAVNRSNIRTAKYRELAAEFRRAGLPLYTDLMLGLPGSTTESFRADLQDAIDHELPAKVYLTEMLVNSPMNEPAYREHHQLRTDGRVGQNLRVERSIVVSSSTFTRDDHAEMLRLRRIFTVADNYGVLRLVSRYVRQEIGLPEADLYADLDRLARLDPESRPHLAWLLASGPEMLVPPVSWWHVLDDVRRDLLARGVVPDGALDAVFAAQHALLPASGRRFPTTLQLPHDVGAWHAAMVQAKDGDEPWWEVVAPLRTFGPASFTVDDPDHLSDHALGFATDHDMYGVWELVSPVARPSVPRFARVD